MKRILSLILAVAVILALSIPALAAKAVELTAQVSSSTVTADSFEGTIRFEAKGSMKHFTLEKSAISASDIEVLIVKDGSSAAAGVTPTLTQGATDAGYSEISISVSGLQANQDYKIFIASKEFTSINDKGEKNYYTLADNFEYPFTTASESSEEETTAAPAEEPAEPGTPKVVQGAEQKVAAGSEATFKSDADFSTFVKVLVDEKEVSKDMYTAKAGSTIVTLKPEFVKTLANGKHTISIVSTTGTATAAFTVETEEVAATDAPAQTSTGAVMVVMTVFCAGAAYVLSEKKEKEF